MCSYVHSTMEIMKTGETLITLLGILKPVQETDPLIS